MLRLGSTSEKVSGIGGIAVVGKAFERFSLDERFRAEGQAYRADRISDRDICIATMGLQCQGRTDFSDIELFRVDPLFMHGLNLKRMMSEETLRQRLNGLARDPRNLLNIRQANVDFLKRVTLGEISTPLSSYIPFDADVSTLDNSKSKKEGVGRTYMKTDGFAPVFGYVGTQGWLLDLELRPGVQHSQNGAPAFFKGCLQKLRELGVLERCLFRLDSGHDAAETIDCLRGHCDFLIKRNPRRESVEHWHSLAKALGEETVPRPGKTVYTGTVEHLRPGSDEARQPVTVVFRVTVRQTDAKGEEFLFPQITFDTWWTSLGEDAKTVIRLYEDHGTSEQFHSELKTDLNLERLPSGTFATNHLFLLLGMLAYNSLRLIDQSMLQRRELLPIHKEVNRRRVGSIIRDVVFVGCKLVARSRDLIIKIWEKNPWYEAIEQTFTSLATT